MTSIASLEAVTLPVDALRRLGERCGVQTWPVVLDLYAGSGALGLEAVSRGAASADLVEKAPRAASVAERNARASELP